MKYWVIPRDSIASTHQEHEGWRPAPDFDLGGCFYDYLRSYDGELMGVRYWVMTVEDFNHHPVFKQFSEDRRFRFNQAAGYVDLVFADKSVGLLQQGLLAVDPVQDFGGEGVVESCGKLGVVFSIDDGA
jgi:hypothetical protein